MADQTPSQHPELARLADKHASKGHQIRHHSEKQLVVWVPPKNVGCLGILIFWILVIVSLGLALLFGILAALDKSGTLITYTVKRNGKIKRRAKRGVR